ncbi:hypothetical protein JSY36_00400 [Bacillus sp. H-16]|uniref:hypothetical protein n=1 Tax=Alteribacter salitolerans TaxID=2912333 RepID=UPI001962F246|nr:hypothetical protein [Alteribacter salitolerans]MBM7094198.1 hypothetical protein [Alteribacter salitolerans]
MRVTSVVMITSILLSMIIVFVSSLMKNDWPVSLYRAVAGGVIGGAAGTLLILLFPMALKGEPEREESRETIQKSNDSEMSSGSGEAE